MSDYETIQRRRNIIVGVFVVAGMCALVWLIFKFGDLPGWASKVGSFKVYVQFPSAPGVQRDTPVRFCGYQIGRVTTVMAPEERVDLITEKKYHQTVAVLSVGEQYTTIPSNVEVKLMTRGLGSSYIELTVDPDTLPAPPLDPNRPETQFLVKEMWLQGSKGVTSEFFPEESQEKLEELVTSVIAFMNSANDIVGDPDNKWNFKAMLANLAKASEVATERLLQAKETLQQAKLTLQQAAKTIEAVEPAIEEFRRFAATGTETLKSTDAKTERLVTALVGASEEIGASAAQLRLILEKINSGQGSAARIINDGKLYERLVETIERLELLIKEITAFVSRAREKGLPIKLK